MRSDRTCLFRGIPRYGSHHPMRSWSLYGPRPRGASAESSRGWPHPLADDRRQLLVAVELAERDLPGGDETEEQDESAVLGRQGALCLHAAPELLVEALDHVGGAQCLPLRLGEAEERQQLSARFVQALDDARTALPPGSLELRPGRPCGLV